MLALGLVLGFEPGSSRPHPFRPAGPAPPPGGPPAPRAPAAGAVARRGPGDEGAAVDGVESSSLGTHPALV
jgi:hypothetical protein